MNPKNIIQIVDISLAKNTSNLLLGYALDKPKVGDQSQTYLILISGWILGRTPVSYLEIYCDEELIQKVPVDRPRADVAQAYSQQGSAQVNSGFTTEMGVIGLPLKAVLVLKAVMENGQSANLGTMELRHQRLMSNYQPKIQPLLVSSTGRSGTTWLMRLLSYHPQIIMSKAYPYESRPALYWMQMLKAMSLPTSSSDRVGDSEFKQEQQWLGRNALYNPTTTPPRVRSWVRQGYPELFASFCQQSIDTFYQNLAQSETKNKLDTASNLIYFAEKSPFLATPLLEIYPQGKEILLVRDFRDIVCSILAFNNKRGFQDFGRQNYNSDAEYIRALGGNITRKLAKWKNRSQQTYLLRYEDLILSPIKFFSDALKFLGLNHDISTVEKILEQASEDNEQLKGHRTSASPKESIGRWKSYLNPNLQQICNEVFSEALLEFGYTVESRKIVEPTTVNKE